MYEISENSIVFRDKLVSDAGAVGDVHFWFIVHVNSLCVILLIFFCQAIGNNSLFCMNILQLRRHFFIELFLLPSKAIDPVVFRFLIVGYYIECSISEIFFSKFERSFNLYFFHATVIGLSFNVWGWNIDSLVGVKGWWWTRNNLFGFPFVRYIDHYFWFCL